MKKELLIGSLLLVGLAIPASSQQDFQPPQVVSAGDAYLPYQVMIDGLFVLDVQLASDGTVRKIDALRDPGSMLGAATSSVRSWKFQAASSGNKSTPTRMTVSFLYRPADLSYAAAAPPKDFSPVLPPHRPEFSKHSDFVPAGVLSFAYPEYPVNSVMWGSVVVQLTVGESGDVKNVEFLHKMAGFDDLATAALKKWRFQPATLNGKSITSRTVIAFVFQAPYSN